MGYLLGRREQLLASIECVEPQESDPSCEHCQLFWVREGLLDSLEETHAKTTADQYSN